MADASLQDRADALVRGAAILEELCAAKFKLGYDAAIAILRKEGATLAADFLEEKRPEGAK